MKRIFISLLILCLSQVNSFSQTKETIAILGDSYSTYEGYLTPDTNSIWYFKAHKAELTDVTDVKQTWWWKVVKEGGYKLGINNSFSGSTICNTGYNDDDYSKRSFVARMTNLGCPDIIFVFGGTNDSWAGAPLGDFKYDDIKRADLYAFRPAMAYMLNGIQNHYPNVKVYVLINTELKNDVTSSIKTICGHYGIEYIQLKDIDKKAGHPSIKGHDAIAKQVLEVLNKHK